MNDIELLTAEKRFHRVVKRDVKCHANHASVRGNRDGTADTIEALTYFKTALAASRRQNRDVMALFEELGTEMPDMLEDATRMRGVIRRYERNLHRDTPSSGRTNTECG